MVVDGKEEKQYDEVGEHLIFSPNSQRTAYNARLGKKWFVVIDGKEGKHYDGIGVPVFSLDSQHLAYAAKAGNKNFVVIDGIEGKVFDGILRKGDETGVSVSADHFYYLASNNSEIYYVEESI